jgi:hypothetical protein
MLPNLQTVAVSVGVLCVHCKSCGHRAALDKERLMLERGKMTQLRDLRLRCEHCGTRGTALKEFELYLPNDFDEAKAFLFGEPLEFRKIAVSSPYLSPMSMRRGSMPMEWASNERKAMHCRRSGPRLPFAVSGQSWPDMTGCRSGRISTRPGPCASGEWPSRTHRPRTSA